MKRLPFILFPCVLIFFSGQLIAQGYNPVAPKMLIAEKYGVEKEFMPGKRLFIKYQMNDPIHDELKARGFFVGGLRDSIVLGKQKEAYDRTLIDPQRILAVRRIRPVGRIVAGAGGIALMAAGIVILDRGLDKDGSGLSSVLIGAPLLFLGTYMTYYVPISLIIEKLSEKRRKNSWTFRLAG